MDTTWIKEHRTPWGRWVDLMTLLESRDKAREQRSMIARTLAAAAFSILLILTGFQALGDGEAAGLLTLGGGVVLLAASIPLFLMRLGVIKNERTGADFEPFFVEMAPLDRCAPPWKWDESSMGGRWLRGWKLLEAADCGVLLAMWRDGRGGARFLTAEGARYDVQRRRGVVRVEAHASGQVLVERRDAELLLLDGSRYAWGATRGPLGEDRSPLILRDDSQRSKRLLDKDESLMVSVSEAVPQKDRLALLLITLALL
mgnify:CR=1 FL=1